MHLESDMRAFGECCSRIRDHFGELTCPTLLPEPYQLVSLTLVSLTNGLRIRLCKAR